MFPQDPDDPLNFPTEKVSANAFVTRVTSTNRSSMVSFEYDVEYMIKEEGELGVVPYQHTLR